VGILEISEVHNYPSYWNSWWQRCSCYSLLLE